MDVAHELGALVATGAPPLDRSLALIAAAGRPQVEPDELVARLDVLGQEVPASDAASLCSALFDTLGFEGNRGDYYDPENSLLDRVLERRTGIPITLSVLGMEIGRRRDVGLVGVGLPGHFLLRSTAEPDLFLDPLDGGRVLDPAGCRRLFAALHGSAVPFTDAYLDPTGPVDVVVRVLNNLRVAHLRRGDRHGLADVLRLQVELPGAAVADRRQLAGVLAAEGHFMEAAALHDDLAGIDDTRADEHRAAATRLRANLN